MQKIRFASMTIDKFAWQCRNNDKKSWQWEHWVNREEILERSRKENKNKDLAELDARVKVGISPGEWRLFWRLC